MFLKVSLDDDDDLLILILKYIGNLFRLLSYDDKRSHVVSMVPVLDKKVSHC